jgi:hypothetical protein
VSNKKRAVGRYGSHRGAGRRLVQDLSSASRGLDADSFRDCGLVRCVSGFHVLRE